jgi:hypothetical protein
MKDKVKEKKGWGSGEEQLGIRNWINFQKVALSFKFLASSI